jgi:hypothetical protein
MDHSRFARYMPKATTRLASPMQLTHVTVAARAKSIKMFRVKDQNILFDFSPQVQTLLPTLSQILYFHLRIYVFRQ